VTFHHNPFHSDEMIDHMMAETIGEVSPGFEVIPGKEGLEIVV